MGCWVSLIYYDLHVWLWWWWSSRKESDLFRSKSLISKQRRNRSSSCWNFPMQGRSLLSASTAIKIKSNQPAIRETKGFFWVKYSFLPSKGTFQGLKNHLFWHGRDFLRRQEEFFSFVGILSFFYSPEGLVEQPQSERGNICICFSAFAETFLCCCDRVRLLFLWDRQLV